jgi:hypothetical protein
MRKGIMSALRYVYVMITICGLFISFSDVLAMEGTSEGLNNKIGDGPRLIKMTTSTSTPEEFEGFAREVLEAGRRVIHEHGSDVILMQACNKLENYINNDRSASRQQNIAQAMQEVQAIILNYACEKKQTTLQALIACCYSDNARDVCESVASCCFCAFLLDRDFFAQIVESLTGTHLN